MAQKGLLEKVAGALALISIAVVVSGTKACQENYEVGAQASRTTTPDPTASPTITPTSEVTSTPTPEPTTATVSSGDLPAPDSTPSSDDGANGLLNELSVLGEKDSDEGDPAPSGSNGGGAQKSDGNWLGKGFNGTQDGGWEDSDGDGFADSREEAAGSDPNDPSSMPRDVQGGQLEARLRQADQDIDGLSNEDEAKRGTSPTVSDSDGDGRSDGAEVLSGGDPLNVQVTYADADRDGLSDTYEQERGLNSTSIDSDGDGLRDDIELVVGSNPLKVDSDGDGVSDGKEYDLGSDPLLGEPDRLG